MTMENKGTVEQIKDILDWINAHYKTNNSTNLSQANTKLSMLAVTLGEDVTNAYDAHQSLQTEYDNKFAKRKQELIEKGMSAAAAEAKTEAELTDLNSTCTQARIIHKKLDSHLDRLDKTIDAVKQQISTINKTDLKNI